MNRHIRYANLKEKRYKYDAEWPTDGILQDVDDNGVIMWMIIMERMNE